MLKCFKKINKKDTGVFAAGLLFGTAGIKLLPLFTIRRMLTASMYAEKYLNG